jgi:hypothetical protein
MIAAHISSNDAKERAGTMLALTHRERIQLRALLERVIEDVERDKRAYLVTNAKNPRRGCLIRDGVDITVVTFETERLAREFRRRL